MVSTSKTERNSCTNCNSSVVPFFLSKLTFESKNYEYSFIDIALSNLPCKVFCLESSISFFCSYSVILPIYLRYLASYFHLPFKGHLWQVILRHHASNIYQLSGMNRKVYLYSAETNAMEHIKYHKHFDNPLWLDIFSISIVSCTFSMIFPLWQR
jgi:hypothetical protein